MTGSTSHVRRFRERSEEIGVPVDGVSLEDATDRLRECCEAPTVAAPLPWSGVRPPEGAATDPTPADLEAARTGVTAAAGAIADYGSLLVRSFGDGTEATSLFPERHVAVLHEDDVVPDMAAALSVVGPACRDEGASTVVATGPSATADMGELVYGAHGPGEVRVLLLEGDR